MKYDIKIDNSICYDFLACMARVQTNNSYQSSKSDKELFDWYEKLKDRLTDEISELISLYFHSEYAFGSMLTGIIKEHNIQNISEFINIISQTSPEYFLKRFIYIGLKERSRENIEQLAEIINADMNAISFINENTIFSDDEKWQILQLIMNRDQICSDLKYLFEWFYNNIYKVKEGFVLEKLEDYKKDLTEKIDLYGDEYVQLLMPFDYIHKKDIKLVLALSYHYESLGMFNVFDRVFVYGYKYFAGIENEHAILAGKQLFKALSDETRLNILRLLSKRPWYGNEIAEKLNISNSTVTHHMATLILNNLVSSYRQEYRIYFKLNTKKVKDIVNNTLESIIE